ncbi:MAG TPA: hypothetical protein VKZ18_14430 [Polyangia bacterium]|nr:hypothetical protein [Polyangia bacterium]
MRWRTRRLTALARIAPILAPILAVCWTLGPRAAAWARDCPLRVVVEGDEPARTKLADGLSKAGIGTSPDPGCTLETVQVRAAQGALELTITDPYGRLIHRRVADLDAAVAVVEATPGSDALLPLLPEAESPDLPGEAPLEAKTPPVLPPASRAATLVTATPPAESAPERGLSLSFATELATGSDGSSWAGVAISGCVVLGPTCVGTNIRFWNDLEPDEESGNAIHHRTTGEIAVAVDVPWTRRRLTLRPGVELGLGWVHMGDFAVNPGSSDNTDFDQGQVVAGAHLAASYRIAGRWALEAGLGATSSIFAHHHPFVVEGTQLPGQPLAFGVVSLGLRYGAP